MLDTPMRALQTKKAIEKATAYDRRIDADACHAARMNAEIGLKPMARFYACHAARMNKGKDEQ